jgi:hypothetical protein
MRPLFYFTYQHFALKKNNPNPLSVDVCKFVRHDWVMALLVFLVWWMLEEVPNPGMRPSPPMCFFFALKIGFCTQECF